MLPIDLVQTPLGLILLYLAVRRRGAEYLVLRVNRVCPSIGLSGSSNWRKSLGHSPSNLNVSMESVILPYHVKDMFRGAHRHFDVSNLWKAKAEPKLQKCLCLVGLQRMRKMLTVDNLDKPGWDNNVTFPWEKLDQDAGFAVKNHKESEKMKVDVQGRTLGLDVDLELVIQWIVETQDVE
ncbi:hypothetical protein EJB05_11146, partial [Eragrostis curvula]